MRKVPGIADNLADIVQTDAAIRAYILHPITLVLLLVLTPVLKLVGYMPLEFPVLGLWGDVAFFLLRIGAYIGLALVLMGRFVRWTMARNLPFVVGTFLFFLAWLCASFTVFHLLLPRGLSVTEEGQRLAGIVLFGIVVHAVLMIVIEPTVRPLLGRVPALVPFVVPVAARPLVAAHAGLIDPSLSGEVRALRAQNQYVLILTAERTHLVRMTFRAAMACLPAVSGQQVHRSWWVAGTELAQGRYDPAAAQIFVDPDRTYPVGKSFERAVMDRMGAPPPSV